jgi:hypothetical protein
MCRCLPLVAEVANASSAPRFFRSPSFPKFPTLWVSTSICMWGHFRRRWRSTLTLVVAFLPKLRCRSVLPVFIAAVLCCGRAESQCTVTFSPAVASPGSWTTATITIQPPASVTVYVGLEDVTNSYVSEIGGPGPNSNTIYPGGTTGTLWDGKCGTANAGTDGTFPILHFYAAKVKPSCWASR